MICNFTTFSNYLYLELYELLEFTNKVHKVQTSQSTLHRVALAVLFIISFHFISCLVLSCFVCCFSLSFLSFSLLATSSINLNLNLNLYRRQINSQIKGYVQSLTLIIISDRRSILKLHLNKQQRF